MVKKPMLQIALDTLTVKEAIENIEKVKNHIDLIEIGTILISSVGKEAIKIISKKYPKKIIVADGKIADAGTVFGNMFFGNGANYTTVICAAETPTIKSVLDVAKNYGNDKEVQIELTSNYTNEQVKEWKAVGVQQIVYHRSRDSQAAGFNWSQKDIDAVDNLSKQGFKVTVTGGITISDIKLFKGIPIYIFIAGRSLRDAVDPNQAAKMFQEEIRKYW